jgi:hypothetical protein
MKCNSIEIGWDWALHLPIATGLTINQYNFAEFISDTSYWGLWYSFPVIVAERSGKWIAYSWETSVYDAPPAISVVGDHWVITWKQEVALTKRESVSLQDLISGIRRAFPLKQPPGWSLLRNTQRIVFLDHWTTRGRILHTYKNVSDLVNDLKKNSVSEGTILYLTGWSAPYDTRYPIYEPAEALGGKDGFSRLVQKARDSGVTIMPHFNFFGYDPKLDPLLDRSTIQARDRAGKPASWAGFSDLFPSNEISYMRINHPDWKKLFHQYFDEMVSKYLLEAVFLDQIGNVVDDPECHFGDASIELLERIRERFPDLLIGGEVLKEFLAGHIGLTQTQWPSDNVRMLIKAHSPIIKYLFEDAMCFFPHFFLPAATPCRYTATNFPWLAEQGTHESFQIYQEINQKVGGIPSVRLDYLRFGIDEVSLNALKGHKLSVDIEKCNENGVV